MATLTPNLKLIIESNLTDSARKNLNTIDSLGATLRLDSSQNLLYRSANGILFLPNNASVGGTGSGGTIQFGTASQPSSSVTFNADTVSFSSALSLIDSAAGGTSSLSISYKSDIEGSAALSDSALLIDVGDGGDSRSLTLSHNLTISGGTVRLSGPADVTLPETGTLVNQNNVETLSNKTLDRLRLTDGSFTASLRAAALTENTNYVLPVDSGTVGQVLRKGSGEQLEWATVSNLSVGSETADTWFSADGLIKTINHGLGTHQITVEVLDTGNDYATILVDSVTRPTDNTVVLTASEAPNTHWLVLIKEIS